MRFCNNLSCHNLLHCFLPPHVIDRLAESYESSTVPIAAGSEIRVLITSGHLVEFMAVYTA